MAGENDQLDDYRRKRNFDRSPEPEGKSGKQEDKPVFVIQMHDASTLHYDLRLEAGGVLKSWAVPKGPSTNPAEKRLALQTEDHPLEYADFEGVIPEEEYGAGAVIVWDKGTYENLSEKDGRSLAIEEALAEGLVSVKLNGIKLQGGYSLVRTGAKDDGRWLLVKKKDDQADARRNPVSTEPESVLSGKTIDSLKKENGHSG
ncbi:MAG: DNA ligase [Firmicutes bacterium ML8_F2]|jgi:DNA ligase D-like protein (predicted 3'-phosphoesterase)|nr:MAG: DNA ligase [Firmicutes bacterium ML8_F2]